MLPSTETSEAAGPEMVMKSAASVPLSGSLNVMRTAWLPSAASSALMTLNSPFAGMTAFAGLALKPFPIPMVTFLSLSARAMPLTRNATQEESGPAVMSIFPSEAWRCFAASSGDVAEENSATPSILATDGSSWPMKILSIDTEACLPEGLPHAAASNSVSMRR